MKKVIIPLLLFITELSLYAQLKVKITLPATRFRMGDEIPLEIYVYNTTQDSVEFTVSYNKEKNFIPEILYLKDATLLQPELISREDNILLGEERKITLLPDEKFGETLDLNEYFKFPGRGRYKVIVRFKCQFGVEGEKEFISNPVYFYLLPSLKDEREERAIKKALEAEEKKAYTPESTIRYMLEARMRGDFESFFRYQQLETVILQIDEFKKKYQKASPMKKKEIIEEYKKWEMKREDMKIESFEILEVHQFYAKNKATVICRINYKPPAIYHSYVYIYKLYKKGNKWIVYDYNVISTRRK